MKVQDLAGKTIERAVMMRDEGYDDLAWMRLSFTDGTNCVIEATYGGYTGNSMDEYPAYLNICDEADEGLVEYA